MTGYRVAVLFLLLIAAGCAENRAVADRGGYVEINNPTLTLYPGAPEKIWVPRESVDHGVPLGGQLLKKGYDAVAGGVGEDAEPAPSPVSRPLPDRDPREVYRENQFR
ncbi:hypothetical protein [Geotalea sp. SG265]|uniref:hypothetical protein n=1 Tax=Geotalea sp. SG265 TaxID=2922867 RepID=UPI001FAFA76D|nr:hypothetical protein [Geotalea sp. SG265]